MSFKRLEIFIIVVIIALIGIVYAFKQGSAPMTAMEKTAQTDQTSQLAPANEIIYAGVDGKTAMELLRELHQVEAESHSFGEFVVSINGIEPDSSHFWSFYVNGTQAQVGPSQYQTKSTDEIKWVMEEIK